MPSWSPSTPSSSIPLGSEDSHLLSQSLPSPDPFDASSHIYTGPGGADLSLSELSLSDKPHSRDGPRFSLLAPPPAPLRFSADQSTILEGEECEEGEDANVDGRDDANNTIVERVVAEKAREEKLQSDLFILKKLNASFAVLNDALKTTKGATEVCLSLWLAVLNQSLTCPTFCQQVAKQLSQTDALLDKYANMLAKSETVTRLIFDERWGGADAVSILDETRSYTDIRGKSSIILLVGVLLNSTPVRTRNCLSRNARKPLNGPDLSEKVKKQQLEKPRNAHAGKQRRLRSGRQKSVPNERQRQLLWPRPL